MRKRRYPIILVMLFAGCWAASPGAGQSLERAVIERHLVEDVRVFGRYAVIQLPIEHGVTIWNPVQVVRGPNGLMYVANHTGEVYTLHDRDGDGLEDSALRFCDVREEGLRSPAGLAFNGRDLYVGTAQEVRVYRDRDDDGRGDTSFTFLGGVPHSEHPYEWTSALTFGPDNYLYAAVTTDSWNAGAARDSAGWRGALLRISPDGGSVERYATGLRSVPGMVVGADGELLFVDNEGGGNRTEELNLALRDHFYGHNPEKYGNPPLTSAMLDLHTDVAPSGIVLNAVANDFDGAGGDLFVSFYGPGERWARGSIARVRLEKETDGTYRAEEIPVLADLPKLADLEFGASGDLYATGAGQTDYWYQALNEPDGAIYRIIHAPWIEPDAPEPITEARTASPEQHERGRQLFVDAACSACHAVDGKTELLGPNLKDIGRIYSRDELLEEIKDPSQRIKPSMAPTRITKRSGEQLLGRVISSTANEIRLMVVGNRIVEIPASEIQKQEPVMQSLMWEGLVDGLTDTDMDALLEYLQSLHLMNE